MLLADFRDSRDVASRDEAFRGIELPRRDQWSQRLGNRQARWSVFVYPFITVFVWFGYGIAQRWGRLTRDDQIRRMADRRAPLGKHPEDQAVAHTLDGRRTERTLANSRGSRRPPANAARTARPCRIRFDS